VTLGHDRDRITPAIAELAETLSRPIDIAVQEQRLGFWRWFWGAFGIGSYGRDDQVDVTWEADGRPQVAHRLPVTPPS